MLRYVMLQDPGVPEFLGILLAMVGLVLIGQVSITASWGALCLWLALVIVARSQIERATRVK